MRTAPTRRAGFSHTHLSCPCPAKEKGCFSEFADAPGRGYCFACSAVVGDCNRRVVNSAFQPPHTSAVVPLNVPQAVVTDSRLALIRAVTAYTSHSGYAEVRERYTLFVNHGAAHHCAFVYSGWLDYATEHTPHVCEQLRPISPFAASFVRTTLVAEILSSFTIGIQQRTDVQFWIGSGEGKYRNAHVVAYDGLCRIRAMNARFRFRSGDGYVIDQFFGAEQLAAGFQAWNGQMYASNTPIVLVEAPKSVLLGAALEPHRIWLASIGTSGVTPRKARTLRNRHVTILFDYDHSGREGAKKALGVLLGEGVHATIADPAQAFGGERPDGWDVGDEAVAFFGERYAG